MLGRAAYLKSGFFVIWMIFALTVGYVFANYDYDVQGGILIALLLPLIGFFLIRRIAKTETPRWLLVVIALALVAKMSAALFRMYVSFEVYGGGYDAARYHNTGLVIARSIRRLDFAAVTPYMQWGTEFTEFYTGVIHAVIGSTLPGAFLVFGIIAFVGHILLYRAFCIAFPHGDRRLYGVLIFLMPSLLYWPNGIGKDALMALFIGLSAYGAARLLTGTYSKGLSPLIAGLLGVLSIRPHMAGVLALALAMAYIFGRRQKGGRSVIGYVAGLGVVGVLAWFLVPRAIQFVGLEEFSPEAIQDYLLVRQTYQRGGSGFAPPSIADPLSFPMWILTVLVRPFPWEAHNLQAFIQASDGLLVLAVTVFRIRTLGTAFVLAPRWPYLLFCIAYVAMFIPLFTTIGNFGTLARERAMLLPLFFAILAFRPSSPEKPKHLVAST